MKIYFLLVANKSTKINKLYNDMISKAKMRRSKIWAANIHEMQPKATKIFMRQMN